MGLEKASRPWWLWVATASFVAYFLFLNTSVYYARELFGYTYRVDDRGIIVEAPSPGGPLAAAGAMPGDRIVAIDGLIVRDAFDLMIVRGNVPAGVPVPILVERNGDVVNLTMRPLKRRLAVQELFLPLMLIPLTISLLLGLLIAWRGGNSATSRIGAWLLASMGCVFLPLWPNGMAQQWRDLAMPLELLMWPAALSSIFVPLLLFAFCARGSNPVLSWRHTLLAALPAVASTAYVGWYIINAVYDPPRAIDLPLPGWFQFAGPALYPGYGAAAALLLWINLRRLTDVTERRRAKTLFAGAVIGGVGMTMLAIGVGASQAGRFFPGVEALAYTGALTFCALPLAFAYGTLRHRLFDLRVIVRLGLQYALARGFLLALIPIAVGVFVIDLVRHSEQPLGQILASRGWTYAAFAGVIGLIYVNRQPWMTALDRRFFRERYAAQQILRDVVEDVASANDFRAAAGKVVSRVDSALHPVVVAVLIKPKSSTVFTPVTTVPATHGVPELPSGGPITQVVRALGRPVAFGSSGVGDVPPDQQRWLSDASVELVVPIATDPSRDEAVLVLGPRRSEEPYSKEDLDLLSAIGASLGLLMGRDATQEETIAVAQADRGDKNKIANRYRIERPIGEGGMGVVFAAVDETLDRPVAIKVIKDQHLIGADALSRFQREARTAASLSHPHIVTVHDYGVDEDGSPYLVMELLEGRSLRVAIRSEGRLASARALPILAGIASAVDAAHAKGVIHRDLKPENVFLVGNTTHAKVLDFGIAKPMAGTTTATTGGIIGTIPYMAPEQASGGPVSPAWDVWSVSVIAYEMLTGVHPFGGGLPIASAVPIRTLAPDLSDEIATAIDAALILEPSKRPRYAISAILRS